MLKISERWEMSKKKRRVANRECNRMWSAIDLSVKFSNVSQSITFRGNFKRKEFECSWDWILPLHRFDRISVFYELLDWESLSATQITNWRKKLMTRQTFPRILPSKNCYRKLHLILFFETERTLGMLNVF